VRLADTEGVSRRGFLALLALASVRPVAAQAPITRPRVSQQECPIEIIEPRATDGHRGLAVLRKPPGPGRFPAIVWVHPGLTTFPRAVLELFARDGANPSRFLAAGYVLILPTYRSRDADPQSKLPVQDLLAVLDHARQLPYVDPASVVVYGCSGGGDLALEVAALTEVAAIVAEEPASFMFTGVFNKDSPKAGALFTPEDTRPIGDNPTRFYSPEMRAFTRTKIARINSPILVVQGTTNWVVPFNDQVLIPELRAGGRQVEVRSYPDQEHCFCFEGGGVPPPPFFKATPSWPRTALQAYEDIERFVRRYIKTRPAPIEPRLVQEVAIK